MLHFPVTFKFSSLLGTILWINHSSKDNKKKGSYKKDKNKPRNTLTFHNSKPMMQFSSFLVNPGMETMINLEPTITYTADEAIARFSPEQRQCYSDDEVELNFLDKAQCASAVFNLDQKFRRHNLFFYLI